MATRHDFGEPLRPDEEKAFMAWIDDKDNHGLIQWAIIDAFRRHRAALETLDGVIEELNVLMPGSRELASAKKRRRK